MNAIKKFSRKESKNIFERLINILNNCDKFHLNNKVVHNFELIGAHKWLHHINIDKNNFSGTISTDFIIKYNIPENSVYIKILRWTEENNKFDNFVGFSSCDNCLGTRFCLISSELRTNSPVKIYDFERKNSRENLLTEKVFGVDDISVNEIIYMPVRLSARVRGEYSIALPSGNIVSVSENDIKDSCIRIIKRKK